MPRRFRADIEKKTAICETITNVMKGIQKGDEAINTLCRLKDNRDFEYSLTEHQGNLLFQRACMEAFVESNDPKNSKKSLGAFAESIVTVMTSDHLPFMENEFWPYYLPPLNVYGLIEEQYLKLSREAWEIDTFREGDWPLLLRAMTIPSSDELFLVRNFDILPMASANIGKRIYAKIDEFRQIKRMYPNL